MIKIHLNDNLNGFLEGILPKQIKDEIIYTCSYEVDGSFFSPQCKMGFWDGRKKLFSSKTQKFPIGLYSLIVETFKKYQIPYSVIDHRVKPKFEVQPYDIPGVVFRPYQNDMVDIGLRACRGIFQAATGAGKSLIIVALALALRQLRINIFVHRSTLLRQLEEDFKKANLFVGIYGDGQKNLGNINIVSLQTILHQKKKTQDQKDRGVKLFFEENIYRLNEFDVMIIDEVHRIASDVFYSISELSKNAYFRFGFSATPWRDDNADILIQAATGKKITELSASKLIKLGYLIKPEIFFIKIPSYPGLPKDYRQIYKKAVVENEMRNSLIVEIANEFVINNLTCLIAVKEIKHGELLLEKLKAHLPIGIAITFIKGEGTSGKQKMKILDDLNKKKLKVVIATTVFGEGINVPTLSGLINAKASKSSVDTLQLYGRTLRQDSNKKGVIIVDIADMTTPYLRSHTRARAKILKTESEFKITESKDLFALKEAIQLLQS